MYKSCFIYTRYISYQLFPLSNNYTVCDYRGIPIYFGTARNILQFANRKRPDVRIAAKLQVTFNNDIGTQIAGKPHITSNNNVITRIIAKPQVTFINDVVTRILAKPQVTSNNDVGTRIAAKPQVTPNNDMGTRIAVILHFK